MRDESSGTDHRSFHARLTGGSRGAVAWLTRVAGLAGRRRVALTCLVILVAIGLLLLVAPPGKVAAQIRAMRPGWVLAAMALELGSCACYPLFFRRFFPEPPATTSLRVSWISMGAGAVLPGGSLASAGATGVLLHRHGISARTLAERCAAMLCLLMLFDFVLYGTAGSVLLAGFGSGPHGLAKAGGPILATLAIFALAAGALATGRRLGARAPAPIRALTAVLETARRQAAPHWRLAGMAGFVWLDMAALWAAFQATGHPLGPLALVIAYGIGFCATAVPVPAGIGVLDSGMAGALVLYGASPAAAVGAVLVYHAATIWVPGLGGLAAWLPARRTATAGAGATATELAG